MQILVTGGNGFVGSHLVKALKKGHEVDVLSNKPGKGVIAKDIRDKDLDLSGYNIIYHLAAFSSPSHCRGNEAEAWDVNVGGTRNILAHMSKGQKIIFSSSAQLYDKYSGKVHQESEQPKPANFYGLTKLVCEHLIQWYSHQKNLSFCNLRFFNIYGPGQFSGFLIPDVISKFRAGGSVEIRNPDAVLDLIYIDNAVEAFIKAQELEGTFNVCSGKGIKVREVYEAIGERMGVAFKSPKASGKRNALVGDNSKILKAGVKFSSLQDNLDKLIN